MNFDFVGLEDQVVVEATHGHFTASVCRVGLVLCEDALVVVIRVFCADAPRAC